MSLRHSRGCDCDDCYGAEQAAKAGPPRCKCCGGDLEQFGQECEDCALAECDEQQVGAPCRAGVAS